MSQQPGTPDGPGKAPWGQQPGTPAGGDPAHPDQGGPLPPPQTDRDRALIAEHELRQAALERIEERRGLQAHLIAYVSVNLLLVVIWAMTDRGFFWPLFSVLGWGIGLAFHVWGYLSPNPTESQVEAEMERLRRRR